jgi:hypothetical protein
MKLTIAQTGVLHFSYRKISEWGEKCRKYGKRSLRLVIKTGLFTGPIYRERTNRTAKQRFKQMFYIECGANRPEND